MSGDWEVCGCHSCSALRSETRLARTWIIRLSVVAFMAGIITGLSAPMLWGHCT